MYWTGPNFNPWDALGLDPCDGAITRESVHGAWRRAQRHVHSDRPGTAGLAFPSMTEVNVARDYFIKGEQVHRLRSEWLFRHRSTWNPWKDPGSPAARRPIPHLAAAVPSYPASSDDDPTVFPSSSTGASSRNNARANNNQWCHQPSPCPEKRSAPADESTAPKVKRARTTDGED